MNVADHFASAETQAHASRFGMWVFLGSELLLFGGLFALYAASRTAAPAVFHDGAQYSEKILGSINTCVLIVSSTLAALSVNAARREKTMRATMFLLATIALGAIFLAIKWHEYESHFHEGIFPGGRGAFFTTHPARGWAPFWTLYFVSTGLHAIHVAVGIVVLAITAWRVGSRTSSLHALENATLYWHLIDVIWIFLWPLYYLA